jgi:hypothetical protein
MKTFREFITEAQASQPKLDKFGRQIGTPLPSGVKQDMLKGGKTASPVGDAAIMAASALGARTALRGARTAAPVIGAAASKAGKFLNKVRVGKMMRQPTQVFDQDVKRGWRSLPTDRSREAALRLYSRRNPNSVDSNIRFHLGQMQAMQGKNPQAIRNMNASKNPNDSQWTPYVDATTAFLKKNRIEFDKAAMRPNYNQAAIERLRQGFDKPYKDAY